MTATHSQQYYILDGVRRAVAAYRSGLKDIQAIIVEQGKPDVSARISLDQLHSPKHQIPRDARYIVNTEYPTQVLKTEPPPIHVESLGLPGQLPTVPITQVQLT
ncbi:MAG TPA: ParB N-terminal domain-containing protein [Gemmataceae bacterium]|jgi:hypothetical protein|nr:ParB N-terminal domain-containing protein [Gemmataceae bacterium]